MPRAHWKVASGPRHRKITNWLRRSPLPAKIRAENELGDEKTVNAWVDGRCKWTDVCNAVLDCVLLVALDDQGNVIRELPLPPIDEDPDLQTRQQLEAEHKEATANVRMPGREPIISIDVPALVRSVADAMKDVAKTAAQQNADAHAAGFQAMTNVVTLCLGILQRVDQRLEEREERTLELEQERAKLLEQPEGDEQQNSRDVLLQAALQQALGGGQAPPNGEPNGHTNGNAVDPATVARLVELFNQFGGQKPAEEGS